MIISIGIGDGAGSLGTLSLDRLRVLVTIADAGSFSAAGRALGRAQSAISQAVATLEELHGISLFVRDGYRPTLTAIGFLRGEGDRQVGEWSRSDWRLSMTMAIASSGSKPSRLLAATASKRAALASTRRA